MVAVQRKQWYVIFCKPHQENQVCCYLGNKGFEVYCPSFPVQQKESPTPHIKPFFPRYLFVKADIEATGTSVLNWIPGTVGLVTYGDTPASIPQGIINELRIRLTGLDPNTGVPCQQIRQGEPVRITQGPLKGYEAIFDSGLSGSQRVRVLLHLLDRQVKVSLHLNAIETL